jgi:hypothetical protein
MLLRHATFLSVIAVSFSTLPASSLGLAVDPPEEGGGCWVGGLE